MKPTMLAMPYLASGDSLSMVNPLEVRICEALAEQEFFVLQPVVNDKRVYQSATKHILEFIGTPANEITLAIRIAQDDLGLVGDLMRLVPVFCKAIDSDWGDAMDWINQGLTNFDETGNPLLVDRDSAKVEFKPIPEIGYIMIKTLPKIKPQAPEKVAPEVND